MANNSLDVQSLRVLYCQAYRCYRSNNLKPCLLICDKLTDYQRALDLSARTSPEFVQLKQLVWLLKIRCLTEDYYVNESLLLNEDDIEDSEQVRVFSTRIRQSRAESSGHTRPTTSIELGGGKRLRTGGVESRQKTGILIGRLPSASLRQSSQGTATSSYRPLTTSLTASQTAFSRSTRPLLKYSSCSLISKPLFEYLYNTQSVNSKCPDYRQCLEYLNIVQSSLRRDKAKRFFRAQGAPESTGAHSKPTQLASNDEHKALGVFWLISFGTCYFNLRMNKQAEEYFQRAIQLNPKHLDSYTWLVKVYLRVNETAKVLKVCEDGLKHSKNSILYNWLARVQSLIGDLYAANLNLGDSLKYYPTNTEALANVGYFSFYGDKLEQSLKCFERIQQLSLNQQMRSDSNDLVTNSSAQLLNNLALCNFYSGFYHKVVPLFFRAFLNSQSKEMTSDIWYNLSFVPLNCGFKHLAAACLRLSLLNNSQNKEALNNLGVLKYGSLINEDDSVYENRQELWGDNSFVVNNQVAGGEKELTNCTNYADYKALYDEAETYFNTSGSVAPSGLPDDGGLYITQAAVSQPETLYNMAIIKHKRGQLSLAMKYCEFYLEHDQNNYHICSIMKEIKQLVSSSSVG